MKRFGVLLLLLFQVGCFNDNKETIRVNLPTNVVVLDPQTSKEASSKEVLMHLFEGLTKENDNGLIVPGVAKSWKITGKTWVFTLNPEAKWENGKKIKADDFVTAWERVLSPFVENSEANKFYIIKNAKEYKGSKIGFDEVGIKALNDETLSIELNEEISYFDKIVSEPIFSPVNKEFYLKHVEDYGKSKNDILGNGPYRIEKWDQSKEIVLKMSKKYYDKKNIKLGKIDFLVNSDKNELKKLYEKNEVQIVNWPTNNIGLTEKNHKVYQTGEIYFVQLNTQKTFLSNAKIRKALAMSIDRIALVKEIGQETESVAESFIPKTILGKKVLFRDEYKQGNYGISYNPTEAKKLFLEGLNELNINFSQVVNINLLVKNDEKEMLIGNLLKNQLKQSLGLDVSVQAETSQMKEQISNGMGYFLTLGNYKAETSNGLEYLSILKYPKYDRLTNWKNLEYDKLLESIKNEASYDNQITDFSKIENLLMTELPMIPIFFTEKSIFAKENVKGIRFSNTTGELDLRYASIEK